MENPRWLRFVIIGLVLAALAVGYFLFRGTFTQKTAVTKAPAVSNQATLSESISVSPKPSVIAQNAQVASPSPKSAYDRIASRTTSQSKGGAVTVLPKTGFPAGLSAIFSISVMITGWGLRRFPK